MQGASSWRERVSNMPAVDSSINWAASLRLSWRLVEIDPSMWEPGEAVGGVVSANVTRDARGALLESGSVTVEVHPDYQPAEFWGRLEVVAEQGGVIERWPVATMLMTPGDMTVSRGRKLVPYDCSSVLKAAADTVLPTGYSVPANGDGAKAAADILAAVLPCPVYRMGAFTLDEAMVLSRGTSRLDAARMLVDAAGWCIQVDAGGGVTIREVPSAPSIVLDSSTASLLCTQVNDGGASYDAPTAYIAVDGLQTARAEVPAARQVEVYDDAPKRVNGETLQDYADRMLSELRAQSVSRSYRRAWVPGVTVFDMVEGNLPEAGLDGSMHITSQRFSLGGEFVVEETVSASAKGRAAGGIASEIEKMLDAGESESKHMATVLRTDNDGTVWVSISGGVDEMPLYGTYVGLEPGDVVEVTIRDGRAVATGNVTSPSVGQRWVDWAIAPIAVQVGEMGGIIRTAEEIAEEAASVAEATNQHFWTRDTDPDGDGAGTGAFVTDDEQAAFLEAAADGFPDLATNPWHNILMNSLGILLRSGFYDLASLTRSGVAFFDGEGNEGANVLASFGKDGAQIGAVNSPNISITPTGIAGRNAEAVPFFSISYDGAQVDARAERDILTNVFVFPSIDGGITFEEDLSSAKVGTKIISKLGRCYVQAPSKVLEISTTNCTYEAFGTVAFYLALSDFEFTAGTSSTATASVSANVRKYGSWQLDIQCSYNASSGKIIYTVISTCAGAVESSTVGFGARGSVYYTVVTYAPSFTFGQRVGGNGAYSTAIGESLYAEGDHQIVLGRYNVQDVNDAYALIIGNGTDDSHRSDALTVDWSGNVACGTVNGVDVTSIGTTATPVSTTTSVESGANVDVASINLAAGTWMVCAKVQFPSNATGRRAIKLSTTSQESGNVVSTNVQTAVNGATMQMSTSRCFTLASAGTVYLVAWQNSGGALSCVGDIEATRIR